MRRYNTKYNELVWEGYVLYTSFEVISEVINRGMRIARDKLGYGGVDFKLFRDLSAGDAALVDIHRIIRVVLSQVIIVERSCDNAAVDHLLVIDRLDFVDRSIVAICGDKSYVLFTNDSDFLTSAIEILTSNPVYFDS
jgi:hypothetical protein